MFTERFLLGIRTREAAHKVYINAALNESMLEANNAPNVPRLSHADVITSLKKQRQASVLYRVEHLQVARFDVLEAEVTHLSLKFVDAIEEQEALLVMYPTHEGNDYFRHMTLPYEYLCVYHVYENTVHKVLRDMRDVASILWQILSPTSL